MYLNFVAYVSDILYGLSFDPLLQLLVQNLYIRFDYVDYYCPAWMLNNRAQLHYGRFSFRRCIEYFILHWWLRIHYQTVAVLVVVIVYFAIAVLAAAPAAEAVAAVDPVGIGLASPS